MNGIEYILKRKKLVKRIAVTGPESTGKSVLSEQLANYYNCLWTPEYARQYLIRLNRPYEYEDVIAIAQEQIELEKQYIRKSTRLLISDTELLVIKIWLEHKYGFCPQWISEEIISNPYDLYLLADIDLPWEYDPMREHPDLRAFFLEKYKNELKAKGLNYQIVSGQKEKRLQCAVSYIDKII